MILNWDDFRRVLGLVAGDHILSEELGSSESVEVESADHAGFIEKKSDGFSLAFVDEAEVADVHTAGSSRLVCVAAHVYPKGKDGYEGFRGALPGGVVFGESIESARKKLGTPVRSGGGSAYRNQVIPVWDKFLFEEFVVHIQYDGGLAVELLTLTFPHLDVH